MNNSITNYVIEVIGEMSFYEPSSEFDKQDICDLLWSHFGLENANDPTYFFIAAMNSVDWDAVEASFFPSSVEVWWDVTIEHRGRTEIEFDDREEYERYKDDPAMYLAEYINHDYPSESYEEDVADISVREA